MNSIINVGNLTAFVEARKLFSRNDTILLAVSGGIDSVVMASLFYEARFRFAIAHCNFGLRGADSVQDEEFVRQLALKFKVIFHSIEFDTETIAAQKGISIQMAARELRYEWFETVRNEHGYQYIATAHHLDDQAETFLINLLRGTGIAGMHGIPVKNGYVIRPLMFACRKEIAQFAIKNKVLYRTDHSNNEIKYLRNKLRHDVIPIFCELNPEFVHGLAETIRKISEFEQIGNSLLEKWCREAIIKDDGDICIDIALLLHTSPVEPYLWALLSPFGFNDTQVSNILGCMQSETRKVFNSATHRLVKERGRLVISKSTRNIHQKEVTLQKFVRTKKIKAPLGLVFKRNSDVKSYVIPALETTASLDFDKLQFPITIRRWHKGDSFYPLGMKKRKKLSDFFIDCKLSMKEKENTWLLCSGKDIAWIIGQRIDHRFRVTQATKEILIVIKQEL